MSRNQRYQCTYSRCSAFFKNGKIYEVGAALVDAKNQEYIHAITDDQGQLCDFIRWGAGRRLFIPVLVVVLLLRFRMWGYENDFNVSRI